MVEHNNLFSESYNVIRNFINNTINDPRKRFKKDWVHSTIPEITSKGFDGYPFFVVQENISEDVKSFDRNTSQKVFRIIVSIYAEDATQIDVLTDEFMNTFSTITEISGVEMNSSPFDYLVINGRKICRRAITIRGLKRIAETFAQNIVNILQSSALGINYPHGNLIVNGKFYISSNAGTSLVILNNPETDLSDMTTITLTGTNATPAICYDKIADKIYGVSANGVLWSLNVSDNTYAIVGSVPQGSVNSAIITNGEYVWATGSANGYIYKIRISDWTLVATIQPGTEGSSGTATTHALILDSDEEYVLGTQLGTGKLHKISIADNTFTSVALGFAYPTDDIVIDGDYIYTADEVTDYFAKVNWKTMTTETIHGARSWFIAQDERYIYFGARDGYICRYDKITSEKINYSPISHLMNEMFIIDGRIFITDYESFSNTKIYEIKLDTIYV